MTPFRGVLTDHLAQLVAARREHVLAAAIPMHVDTGREVLRYSELGALRRYLGVGLLRRAAQFRFIFPRIAPT